LRFYSRAKKEVIQSCASALTTKARDLVMNIYQHWQLSKVLKLSFKTGLEAIQ